MSNGRIYTTIAAVFLVLVALVALVGYPLLIWVAVLAAWGGIAVIVLLSAGDMLDKKPARPAVSQEETRRADTQRASAAA